MIDRKAILVVGAGDATGGAIARRFACEGFVACVTRRTADKLEPLVAEIRELGGEAHGFASDARKEVDVQTLVAHVEQEIAPIEVAVFNIGANVRFDVVETTERVYRKVWEMAALGGFLMGREVAKVMLARGHGTIIFTGATASLRGSAGFSGFAGAKHALRALAQSMARELGPKGIHVAHVVIDGAIDTQFVAENFPERYALKEKAGILSPAAIAENYWNLHCQDKSAWTHELDLRPLDGDVVMSRSVEYFFDFGSPTSYLAWTQLPRIASEAGATIVWRPMLLGGVFKATGNASPVSVPAKGRWMNSDIALWAKRYGVPFRFNPSFPINTLPLMRGAVGLQMRQPQDFERYLDVVHRAMWEQPKNLGDPAVIASVLAENGFDSDAFMAMIGDAEVKARLVANTEEAVTRGVFGAPTFFVGDRMFFGQDRLEFVREALVA